MAANDILAALLQGAGAGGRTATGDSSLNSFLNTVAENDIYRQIADPLSKVEFDYSGMSNAGRAGLGFGQAFISGLLNEYGKRQEGEQLQKVAQILPQLYANPQGLEAPQGVDTQAFQQLKLGAIKDLFDRQTLENLKQKEYKQGLLKELFKAKPNLAIQALGIDTNGVTGQTPFEIAKEKFGDETLARKYVEGTDPELKAMQDEKDKGGSLQSNLDYVNKQFDDALNISTLSTFNPLGTANSQLDAIRTGLKTNLQNVYGREINESQQKELNNTLPDWNDTKAQIESKRQKALEIIAKLKGESPEKIYQLSDNDKKLLNSVSEEQLRNFAAEAKKLGLSKEQAQAKLINILKKQNG